MFTTFKASVARSAALSDVAVLLMEKCEAWYNASQARKAAATVSQYCCVAASSIVAAAAGRLRGVALGFATTPASSTASYVLRWSADSSGLAGGLGYTVEPDFCAKLMPQFEDREYITCSFLESAILASRSACGETTPVSRAGLETRIDRHAIEQTARRWRRDCPLHAVEQTPRRRRFLGSGAPHV